MRKKIVYPLTASGSGGGGSSTPNPNLNFSNDNVIIGKNVYNYSSSDLSKYYDSVAIGNDAFLLKEPNSENPGYGRYNGYVTFSGVDMHRTLVLEGLSNIVFLSKTGDTFSTSKPYLEDYTENINLATIITDIENSIKNIRSQWTYSLDPTVALITPSIFFNADNFAVITDYYVRNLVKVFFINTSNFKAYEIKLIFTIDMQVGQFSSFEAYYIDDTGAKQNVTSSTTGYITITGNLTGFGLN